MKHKKHITQIEDMPPYHPDYKRLENSPTFDPNGKEVYYGDCKCGCITEDRGVIVGQVEGKQGRYQLHWCYGCKVMLYEKIK